jgi:hypothetical protein
MNESTTFKFNLIFRIIYYAGGVVITVFAVVMGGVLYRDWGMEGVTSSLGALMAVVIFAWLMTGLSLIRAPSAWTLEIYKNGFQYKKPGVVVHSHWVACMFDNQFARIIGANHVLAAPFNKAKYSWWRRWQAEEYKDTYTMPIPLFMFGGTTSKSVKEKIREVAPYLFDFLLTETEFLSTLNALDDLMARYTNKEIPPQLFFNAIFHPLRQVHCARKRLGERVLWLAKETFRKSRISHRHLE